MQGNTIYIFGSIGIEVFSGDIANQLERIDGNDVTVKINSNGGSVTEGFAIYDLLASSEKNITVEIIGMCASIATVIAFAGKNRIMSPNAQFMIHNPWTGGNGEAKDLEKQAARLRGIEGRLSQFYADRTNSDIAIIKGMMENETFITPEQALEMGFITEISKPVYALAFDSDNQKQNGVTIKEMKDFFNKKLDAIKASISGKTEEPKILAYELALENGEVLISNSPANSNEPTIGDSVSLKGKSEAIEDGEYVIASSSDMLIVEAGKVKDIGRHLESIEASIDQAITPVIETVAEVASVSNARFEAIEASIKAGAEKIGVLETSNTNLLEKNTDLASKNEALEKQLTELKASVGSTYTAPGSHEIQASKIEFVPTDATHIELEKIKNRNSK